MPAREREPAAQAVDGCAEPEHFPGGHRRLRCERSPNPATLAMYRGPTGQECAGHVSFANSEPSWG